MMALQFLTQNFFRLNLRFLFYFINQMIKENNFMKNNFNLKKITHILNFNGKN